MDLLNYSELNTEKGWQTPDDARAIAFDQFITEMRAARAKRNEGKTQEELTMESNMAEQRAILEIGKKYPEAISTNEDLGKEARFQAEKKARHDYAYFDSTEKHKIDKLKTWGAETKNRILDGALLDEEGEWDKENIVSVEEIRKRAHEAGVELKHSKPLSKTALEYYIGQELQRKQLAEQLAYFKENPTDYGAWQQVLLNWADISGRVGGLETASWIGMAVAGAGAARLLTGAAELVAGSSNLAKGVALAREGLAAQKANTVLNAGIELEQARKAGFAAKFGYDYYRFGQGAIGTAASVPSLAATFALDGALTTIPMALARQSIMESEGYDFNWKDALSEIAWGAIIPGAGVPIIKAAAAVGRPVAGALGTVKNSLLNAIAAKSMAKEDAAAFKGQTMAVARAQEEGKTASEMTNEMFRIASGEQPTSEKVVEAIVDTDAMNITAEESASFVQAGIEMGITGDPTNAAKIMAHAKGPWLSKVPYVYQTIKNLYKTTQDFLGRPVSDFLEALKQAGSKTIITPSSKGWLYRVSFGTERINLGGALDRIAIRATNKQDAQRLFRNMYVGMFSDNQTLREIAREEVQKQILQTEKIRDILDDAIRKAEVIRNINDFIKHGIVRELKSPMIKGGIPLEDQKKQLLNELLLEGGDKLISEARSNLAERLGDGGRITIPDQHILFKRANYSIQDGEVVEDVVSGTLRDQMEYLFTEMLSREDRFAYVEAMIAREEGNLTPEQVGLLEKLDNEKELFINRNMTSKPHKLSGELMYNFKNAMGGTDQGQDVRNRLGDLIEAIDNEKGTGIAQYNRLDEEFNNTHGSMDDIIKAIEKDEPIETVNHVIDQPFEGAAERVRDLARSDTESMTLYNEAQANFRTTQEKNKNGSDIFNKVMESFTAKLGKGTISGHGVYALSLSHSLRDIDLILHSSWGNIRKRAIDNIKNIDSISKLIQEGMEPSAIRSALTEVRPEVKAGIKKAILDESGAKSLAGLTDNKIGAELENAVDEVIEQTITEIEETLAPKAKPNEINFEEELPAPVKEGEEVREIAPAGEVVDSTEQSVIEDMDELLKPLMGKIGGLLLRRQAENINTLSNFVADMERWHKHPGVIFDTIMSKLSSVAASPVEGAGLSIEALADPSKDMRDILTAIANKTSQNSGADGITRNLASYAKNPKNNDDIERALAVERLCLDIADKNVKKNLRSGVPQDALKVAKVVVDKCGELAGELRKLGADTTMIGSIFDPAKIANAVYYYTGNSLNNEYARGMVDILGSSKNITDEMKQLFGLWFRTEDKVAEGYTNLGFHFLENLHLGKQFGKGKRFACPLDALREGLTSAESFDNLFNTYYAEDILESLKAVTHGMHGDNGKELGLIRGLHNPPASEAESIANYSSRFLEDSKPRLFFKDTDTELNQLQYFGHDNWSTGLQADLERAAKQKAILQHASSDPYRFFNAEYEMAREYLTTDIIPRLLNGNAEQIKIANKLKEDVNSDTIRGRLRYLTHTVCGTNPAVSRSWYRAYHVLSNIFAPGMLMAAGFKSLADYANQVNTMVNMGFISRHDIGAKFRIYGRIASSIATEDGRNLREMLALQNASKLGFFQDQVFGSGMASYKEAYGFGGTTPTKTQFSKYTPMSERIEKITDNASKFVSNKLGWITGITDFNHDNAVMEVMFNLGNLPTNNLSKEAANRIKVSLNRYNMSEYEWENIYSKKCIMSAQQWADKQPNNMVKFGKGTGDQKLFFHEQVLDLSDKEISQHLTAQSRHVSPESIEAYRKELYDKAAAMINSTAHEMTTLPTAQVAARTSLNFLPGSGLNFAMSQILKFQSYNMANAAYHRNRAIAKWEDPNDPLLTGMLHNVFTNGQAARNLFGSLTEVAVANTIIENAYGFLTGHRRKYTKPDGTPDWEYIIGHGLCEQYVSAFGGFGSIVGSAGLQALGVTEGGASRAGSITLSVSPTESNILTTATRIASPALREDVENKPLGVLAGTLDAAARISGVAGFMPTKALYLWGPQDWLNRMEYSGAQYWNMRERQEERYTRGAWGFLDNMGQ